MSKLGKRKTEKSIYAEAASDGLTALLTAGKESMDGAPIVKVVLGGILWIVETCRQFKGNKQEWESFASYLLDLHHDLLRELDDSVDNPPARMLADFRKLQQSLESVTTELNSMKKRSGFLKLVQVREDPKRIVEFRQRISDALAQFNVLQLISIRKVLEIIQIGCTTTKAEELQRSSYRTKCCPPPTPLFTGRRALIDSMHAAFAIKLTTRRVFVLHGLGGAGKSQIAYRFVEESQRVKQPARFYEVLYIDASSEASIIEDLQNIARAKHVGDSDHDTLNWLCRRSEEWLLIFNNADVTSFPLSKYFPSCSHGNILITSRNRDMKTYASPRQLHRQISGMVPQDAMDLLLAASGAETPTKVEEESAIGIVQALGHLALAVIQAGAYISKTGCSLQDYIELYSKRRKGILEEYHGSIQRVDDYKSTVYTTWKISFEQLSTVAQDFMKLCACLHFDGIPEWIFRNATERLGDADPSDEPPAVESLRHLLVEFQSEGHSWDVIKFNRVLSDIQSYSFIDLDTRNRTYSIHPLVHDWALTTQSDIDVMRTAAKYLLARSVNWKFTSEDYALRRSLLLHVVAVSNHKKEVDTNISSNLALVYSEAGRWKEAEVLQATVMETKERMLGKDHPDTLNSVSILAETYKNQGRLKEAEALEVRVLETRGQALGEEHLDTLTSKASLASTYWSQGRWSEAEMMEVAVMEARKRLNGDKHPDTLTSIGNLAETYRVQGRWKEAETLGLTVMETRMQLLGEEHPDTFTSMSNLAVTYRHLGRWKEAEALYVKVIEARKRVIGEEHPDTLTSQSNLAITYFHQGRWQEAEVLQVMIVEMREELLGEEHPKTLTSKGNLAQTYCAQARWKEAEALEVTVMEAKKRILGEEHPDTLTSMACLASTYWSEGRWKEAETLEVAVMEIRKRRLGDEHPDTLSSMGNLAATYRRQGRYKEAESLQVMVMEIKRRLLGEEHPETIDSMSNLAVTYRNQGRWKEAEALQVAAVEMMKRLLGEEHPDTLTCMSNLAITYWNQCQWRDAELLEVRVMQGRRRLLGDEHPDTLASIENLATTYRKQDRLEEAEALKSEIQSRQ